MHAALPAAVKLYLAGTLYLTIDEKPVTSFHSHKTQALLAFLILEKDKTIDRDTLAAIFWEGYTRKSGRANLRMSLSNLRQILGDYSDVIETTRNTVRLSDPTSCLWCDVWHVEKAIALGTQQQLQMRLAAFDRVLLAGFEEIDSSAFNSWLMSARETYAQLILQLRQPVRVLDYQPRAKHNLPRVLKPIFGRSHDSTAIAELLASPEHALVTLVGQGGVGKTALALTVARNEMAQYPDGVWLVRLENIRPTDATVCNQVAQQIAHSLQLVPHGKGSLIDQLKRYLQTRTLLLILDNFEHVMGAAPLLIDLLEATQNLKVIVTSRRRLNSWHETVYFVNGLSTALSPLAPSVQLFCERYERAGHDVQEEQLTDIAGICQLLNGLPLGIELATALGATYQPDQLYNLLQHDLTVLETDTQTVPKRQRQLWTIIAYSWQQLTWEEQRVLLQLTVMDGAFSAEIAQAVTQTCRSTIDHLHNSGFLTAQQHDLFTIHPQIRTFCLERTDANPARHGWLTQATYRHAISYLEQLVQQAQKLPQAIAQIQAQLSNIERAWQWCVAHNFSYLLAEASVPLADCLEQAGLGESGIAWFEKTLQLEMDARCQLHLRNALATLYVSQGNYSAAMEQLDQLRPALNSLPSHLQIQMKLTEGHLHRQMAHQIESAAAYQAVVKMVEGRSADYSHFASRAAYHLGWIYAAEKSWEAAETIWEKGYQLAADDRYSRVLFHQALGQAAYEQTDYDTAWQQLSDGLALADEQPPFAQLHHFTALTAYQRGAFASAKQHLLTALTAYQEQQDRKASIEVLHWLGHTEEQLGNPSKASAIKAEVSELRERWSLPLRSS